VNEHDLEDEPNNPREVESTAYEMTPTQGSSFADKASTVGGCLLSLVMTVAAPLLLFMLIKGTPWMVEHVYPRVQQVVGVVVLVVIPISLLLAVFRGTSRAVGGIGLFASSYVVGLYVWLWSLVVAYVLAGTTWMVIGIIFGGVGVIPIAFVAAVIRAEWWIAIQIGISVVIIGALRGFGMLLVEKGETSRTRSLGANYG
jgi:hypothetical protein